MWLVVQLNLEPAGHAEQHLLPHQDAAQGQPGGPAVSLLRAPHQERGGARGVDGEGGHG